MATPAQIRARVLAYFRQSWPSATAKTNLREDLLLNDDQIVDIGTELAIELGCNPTRTQLRKCKTIGDLSELLVKTRAAVTPVAAITESSLPRSSRASKKSRPKKKSRSKSRTKRARRPKTR